MLGDCRWIWGGQGPIRQGDSGHRLGDPVWFLMDRYFGRPPEPPYFDERDLSLLTADLGAGYHPAAEIYDWYVSMIAAEYRSPISKKAFGLALKEAKLQPSVRALGDDRRMTRCWLLTRPWERRGNAILAEELAAEKAKST